MASEQMPAILVARFLKANHYSKTLDAFLHETNLTEKAAITNTGDWTLEKLLEEKVQFDTSLNFERTDNDSNQGWTRPAPSVPTEPELPISTNVLCINSHPTSNALAITTANNICNYVTTSAPYAAIPDQMFKADSPVLATIPFNDYLTASTTMSGKLLVHEHRTGRLLAERRDHSKWAVQVAAWSTNTDPNHSLIATAGWDQKVHIYNFKKEQLDSAIGNVQIDQPAHTITLPSNPESLVFVPNPDTGNLYLVVSRRDSSFLHYFRITLANASTSSSDTPVTITVTPAGRQNLAPHSNAWVAFTPSALALHPSDPTLLAVATSHLPHLKVIVVRMLFPDTPSPPALNQPPVPVPVPQTAAAQARADLALQDREDAAITLQVSTQAPQTPYSTPQICWRPDGSGMWVNGDDGVVRGVEAKTGKVVALLRAHEVGSKVRTLWAGRVTAEDGTFRELLVSGGFDRKVFVWEVSEEESES